MDEFGWMCYGEGGLNFTCVTIVTIAQQKPPKNAVANIVSTDLANTVRIQDSENGNDITVNSRRRPNCIARPPNIPPKRAPAARRTWVE